MYDDYSLTFGDATIQIIFTNLMVWTFFEFFLIFALKYKHSQSIYIQSTDQFRANENGY